MHNEFGLSDIFFLAFFFADFLRLHVKYACYYLQSYKFIFKNYCNLRKDIFLHLYNFLIFLCSNSLLLFHYIKKINLRSQLERYQNRFFRSIVYKAEQPRYKYNSSRYSSSSRYKYRYSTLMTTVIQTCEHNQCQIKNFRDFK